MDNQLTIGDFEAESRLIVPVAFQGLNTCMRAINKNLATKVIIESGTQLLPISSPSSIILEDLEVVDSAADMCFLENVLKENERKHIFLVNTARSQTADVAYERAKEGHKAIGSKYIKLEVFREHNVEGQQGGKTFYPVDNEVYKAVERLIGYNRNL